MALLNAKPELQSKIAAAIPKATTSIAVYDLVLLPDHMDYNLSVLSLANLIIVQEPPMHHWITGFVVSQLNCYYWEFDSLSLNTLYKLSLRQLTDENLVGVVDDAIQRKCNSTLQLLPKKPE